MSNVSYGDALTAAVQDYLSTLGRPVQPEFAVEVGLSAVRRKLHTFDLGNDTLLVECKRFAWTAGGNSPSAKLATLNEALLYFVATPAHYRKLLVLAKAPGTRGGETLAAYYVRRYGHLIPPTVEVWEFDLTARTAERLC